MATVHYKTCDHCGKKLEPMVDYGDLQLELKTLIMCDLCADCLNEIEDIVCRFLRGAKENA